MKKRLSFRLLLWVIIFRTFRPDSPDNHDSYVLEVISAILSGGKSSRFYQSLVREKRLVLSADADDSLLSKDPVFFYLSADLLPGKDMAEVEKALNQEVERLQEERVGEPELEKVKNKLEASFVFGQDSLFYQALLLAHSRSLLVGEKSIITFPRSEKSLQRTSSGFQNNTLFLTTGPWESSSPCPRRRERLRLRGLLSKSR